MSMTRPQYADISPGRHAHIVDLMREAGVNGTDLSRRVRVDESTVSRWRTGKSEVPGAVIAYLELLAAIRHAAS